MLHRGNLVKLVPNEKIRKEISKSNLDNKNNMITDQNIPLDMYNNLNTTGKDSIEIERE